MKTRIFIPMMILFPLVTFSQLKETADLTPRLFFKTNQHLPNNVVANNKYHSNGKPILIYIKTDSSLIRKEYYEEGSIKCISEIIQEIGIDTTTYYDLELKKEVISIVNNLYDNPHGTYTEYYKSYRKAPKIKCEGKAKKGRKVGEWKYYNIYSEKTIAEYNKWGFLDGKFKEYYFSKKDSIYSIATEGEYELIPSDTINLNMENITYYITKINSRKKGDWKYYTKEGKYLGKASYHWID